MSTSMIGTASGQTPGPFPGFDTAVEFPSYARGIIHLNHAGVSPLPARAAEAIARYAAEASETIFTTQPRWFAAMPAARECAARLLNAGPDEIAFTKGTTHGFIILANSIRWMPGDVIVTEEATFPSNWYVWKSLEERFGVRVVQWPERDFRYELEDLRAILRGHPVRMVSISAASYSTGFRHDLKTVGSLCREAGAMFCLDVIRQLGAIGVDVRACGVDFASADGHKWLLGPEGAGVLFVRRERLAELNESCCGWIGRQNFMDLENPSLPPDPSARRFEEGAPNHVGILALGEAMRLLCEVGMETIAPRVRENARVLESGFRELGWRQISPRGEAHASGIVIFDTAPSREPGAVAKALTAASMPCVSRRGFLRTAPHFYQTPADMERVVRAAAAI
ncbi:aminotransferase class V-fold PLP-dependent enzyme [Candidatus Poribacteria bacterium]|nr:aminotransferase class V-fold PLP-dependent enzyme [Candidatus Poribacteria bacterium]